jgi:myo-inositol-hexaphosphate 3-phosphohydrolase
MHKIFPVIISILIIASIQSCSKRNVPSRTEEVNNEIKVKTTPIVTTTPIVKKNDSLVAVKPAIKKPAPTATPKVIAVNDKFAKKSVDGRYYYDLEGHRYWRSNKDGKYYLYNKSMQTDEAFMKPQK